MEFLERRRHQLILDLVYGFQILPISVENREASTTVEFNTSTYGFGITPTIGVGGGFLALDMNVAWTDVPQLDKPARSFVFGPRFGKNFKLNKLKHQNNRLLFGLAHSGWHLNPRPMDHSTFQKYLI